jgi:Peptidase M50B-like
MDALRALVLSTHPVPPGAPAPLAGGVAALIGVAALAVVLIPFLRPLAEHFNVMAHEGAHAATGAILGFAPQKVVLMRNATGGTEFASRYGPRAVAVGAIGYLGPSMFGLWAAKLIETGRVVTVLWIAVILLVLLLFLIRESFGRVTVPVAIAVLALVMHYAHSGLEEFTTYGMTWLLLLSGVRVAVADGARAWDAGVLSELTRIPRRLWALLWLAGTLLAVVIGGKWLILGT